MLAVKFYTVALDDVEKFRFLLCTTSHKCNRIDVDLFYPDTDLVKYFSKHLFFKQ